MGKEKKSLQGNIIANSLMYGILSIAAITLGLFFAYFGLFFSVLAISGLSGEFVLMNFLQAGLFISASILIFYIIGRNSKWLWAQWQRKQALDAEDERVSRLIDDSAENDSEQVENTEMMQQNKNES